MTILTLDTTLEPLAPRKPYAGESNPRDRVIARCLSQGAVTRDWRAKTITEKEIIFATSVPESAEHFHYNYLGYLQKTYGRHHSIVLAPHHFWYTVLAEIAQAVVSRSLA